MRFQRPSGGGGGKASPGGELGDPWFIARFPALAEFLSAVQWDDGKRRVPGSLTLFVEEGLIKTCLNDKDGGNVCFLTADTLEGLLGSLEKGLVEGGLDWRRSKPMGGKK